MSRISLIVFDLSGTTIVDDHVAIRGLYKAAREFNLNVTLEDLFKWNGTNIALLFQFMIARSQGRDISLKDLEKHDFKNICESSAKIFHRYTEIMIDYYRNHVKAMPGAEETFRWCRSQGIKIAIDTEFHRDVNHVIMEGLKWQEYDLIDLAVDSDSTHKMGRPSPFMIFYAMEKLNIKSECEVIKIGDTPADLLSGLNAGCKGNIGVQSGAYTKKILKQYRHTHIIPSIRELPLLIEEEFQAYDGTYF